MPKTYDDDEPLANDEEILDDDTGEPFSSNADDLADLTLAEGYRKRAATIKLKGAYDGKWVKLWINAPRSVTRKLGSEEEVEDGVSESDMALCRIILDHNFTTSKGTPLAKPLTAKELNALPMDLCLMIIRLHSEALQRAAGIPKR